MDDAAADGILAPACTQKAHHFAMVGPSLISKLIRYSNILLLPPDVLKFVRFGKNHKGGRFAGQLVAMAI